MKGWKLLRGIGIGLATASLFLTVFLLFFDWKLSGYSFVSFVLFYALFLSADEKLEIEVAK